MQKYDNIILHIPHSSKKLPIELFNQYTNTWEFRETIYELTDVYVDELFDIDSDKFNKVIFQYTRLYCDVERFLDDSKEHMSEKGMGVLYTHGINNKRFRNYTKKDKELVIEIYNEHHDQMKRLITSSNKPLIIDCHSFSNRRYVNDGLNSNNLPDFCIGFNNDNTNNPKIVEYLKSTLEGLGYTVSLNEPFSGSIYYEGLDHHSVMIEINKKLYVNEDGVTKKPDFYKIKSLMNRLLKELVN